MLMVKKPLLLSLLLGLCLFSTLSLTAEEVVLVYADRMEEVTIFDSAGSEIFADFGTSLYEGYLISLGSSSAELQYRENGTILKLREGSTLKIESFQESEQPKSAHKLSLVRGKMRTVAARLTDSRYSVRTPSSALGIRGTDFIIDVNPVENRGTNSAGAAGERSGSNLDILTVLSGQVEALDLGTGRSVLLDQGRQLLVGMGIDGIEELSADRLEDLADAFGFTRADPQQVPSMEGYRSDFDLQELWEGEDGTIPALPGAGPGREPGRSGAESGTEGTDREGPGSGVSTSRTIGGTGSTGSSSGGRSAGGGSATDRKTSAPASREAGDGASAQDRDDDAPSARLLVSLDGGYTIFTSPEMKEISDGGFFFLGSFAGRIEGSSRIDLGFRAGAIFCEPKLDAIESYTMIPITFFAGIRVPLSPVLYFGGEAGAGFEHLLIHYHDTTGFADDEGFTPLVEGKLLAGLQLGFLELEVKAGLSGFYDNGFQLAIPVSLGVSMGMEL